MKKLIIVFMALAGFAFATTPGSKVTALTPSAGTTGDNYDAGAEVSIFVNHTTTAVITNGSALAIAKVPAQSRILSCELSMAASGVNSTNTVGLIAVDGSGYYSLDGSTSADDTDAFLTAFSTSNAVNDTFADLSAGDANAGLTVEKDVYIVIDGASAGITYPTNKAVKAVVRYIR